MQRQLRRVLGVAGVVATLLGGLAVVAPTFVAETEPFASVVGAASAVGPQTPFVVGSVAGTLYLVVSTFYSPEDRLLAGNGSAGDRFERTLVDPPESVSAADGTLVASGFDAAVERAIDGDGRALERVRDRLQRLVVARLTRGDGPIEGSMDEAEAKRALATGAWTETRTAAAFCADGKGPTASIGSRLRLWLDAGSERERRIRATVATIESLGDGPGPGRGRGEQVGSAAERERSAETSTAATGGGGESAAGGVSR